MKEGADGPQTAGLAALGTAVSIFGAPAATAGLIAVEAGRSHQWAVAWISASAVWILAVICIGIMITWRAELGVATVRFRVHGAELLLGALTRLAGVLAGGRHAHLREAWAADLCGDPGTGELPPVSRRLRLAAGDVIAALRCRPDDAADLAWRPVKALLSSWHGSNLAILLPVTVAAGLVLSREGFYGLINDADNLGVIATAPYLAIKGLRKYCQIDTPKRPGKKAPSADGTKR